MLIPGALREPGIQKCEKYARISQSAFDELPLGIQKSEKLKNCVLEEMVV